MKNISLILLFVILASCSADRASVEVQKDGFSVTPKYCYANDCYSVTRATMIQIYNDRLPDGSYAYKMTGTGTIDSVNQEAVELILNIHVKGDIVTVDTEDSVYQFNQKTREVIKFINKTGEASEDEDIFRKMFGSFFPRYASSGDVINYDMKTSIQFKTINLRINMFVHGMTEYKGKNYPLLEMRGGGSLMLEGHKMVISLSGYALMDGTTNMPAKNVWDWTFRYRNNLKRVQMIMVVKEIKP